MQAKIKIEMMWVRIWEAYLGVQYEMCYCDLSVSRGHEVAAAAIGIRGPADGRPTGPWEKDSLLHKEGSEGRMCWECMPAKRHCVADLAANEAAEMWPRKVQWETHRKKVYRTDFKKISVASDLTLEGSHESIGVTRIGANEEEAFWVRICIDEKEIGWPDHRFQWREE